MPSQWQSLAAVEITRGKAEAETAKAAEPTEDATEPETDELAAPKSRQRQSLLTSNQSRKNPTDNNPEEDTEMDPKDIAKMQLKNQLIRRQATI